MDELIRQLNHLRIEEILASTRSTSENQTSNDPRNNRRNHLRIGETARITNKGEYGTVGKVTRVSGRMVDIKDSDNNSHTRAWWNLERVADGDSAQ